MTVGMKIATKGQSRVSSGRMVMVIVGLSFVFRLVYCLAVFGSLVQHKGEELGWVVDGRLAVDPLFIV